MSDRDFPDQCPECLHADGKHRYGCKVKAAWDAACVPWTVEDIAIMNRRDSLTKR